ncbi:hypothetical protein PVBG_05210 [Plasmodium vivax Brazil I]|uniref:Uncharacterized protein n=1 Tax=Plasmodium vivax (strain Brazil I) TaxID=1033975 RepID=A0A0J9SJP1_PLAV1|nr:hypothetical protein PVBG_05210 [Plasmodium vivax Brazil I]
MDKFFFRNYYPFLKKIWENYGYDEDLDESKDNFSTISLCNDDTIYGNNASNDKKNACKKLLKNFELLRINERDYTENTKWCNNLNNWIYNEINPYILTDAIVRKILNKAQPILNQLPNKRDCIYNYVKEQAHLEQIIELRIFNDNMKTFQSILKNESGPVYCSCQNFLQDCVNIYNDMKKPDCFRRGTQLYSSELCIEINQFQYLYALLSNDNTIVKKIPDLYTGIREEELNCQSTVETLEAQPSVDSLSDARIQKTDSTASAVPTALGTVAGASSVLALLYKVNRIFHLNICTTQYIDYYFKLYKKFS